MNGETEISVVIGAFVAVVTGFLAVAKIMLSAASKEREADRLERIELRKSIDRSNEVHQLVARASNAVATATIKAAKEAEQRNGHLSEQTIKVSQIGERQAKLTQKIIDRLEKTAVIDMDTAHDGGLLVKTKPTKPLDVKVLEK